MARSRALKNNHDLSNGAAGNSAQNRGAKGRETVNKISENIPAPKAKGNPKAETAEEQRNMILAMFFDDHGADGFLDLVKHCRNDLTACDGDTKQIPNVILGHYRISRGRYDIDRAANDLLTFPPVAARIAELKAQRVRREKC